MGKQQQQQQHEKKEEEGEEAVTDTGMGTALGEAIDKNPPSLGDQLNSVSGAILIPTGEKVHYSCAPGFQETVEKVVNDIIAQEIRKNDEEEKEKEKEKKKKKKEKKKAVAADDDDDDDDDGDDDDEEVIKSVPEVTDPDELQAMSTRFGYYQASHWAMFLAEFWHLVHFILGNAEYMFPRSQGYIWAAQGIKPGEAVNVIAYSSAKESDPRFVAMLEGVFGFISNVQMTIPSFLFSVGFEDAFIDAYSSMLQCTEQCVDALCSEKSFLGGCSRFCGGEGLCADASCFPTDNVLCFLSSLDDKLKGRGAAACGYAHTWDEDENGKATGTTKSDKKTPEYRDQKNQLKFVWHWMAVRDMLINLRQIGHCAMLATKACILVRGRSPDSNRIRVCFNDKLEQVKKEHPVLYGCMIYNMLEEDFPYAHVHFDELGFVRELSARTGKVPPCKYMAPYYEIYARCKLEGMDMNLITSAYVQRVPAKYRIAIDFSMKRLEGELSYMATSVPALVAKQETMLTPWKSQEALNLADTNPITISICIRVIACLAADAVPLGEKVDSKWMTKGIPAGQTIRRTSKRNGVIDDYHRPFARKPTKEEEAASLCAPWSNAGTWGIYARPGFCMPEPGTGLFLGLFNHVIAIAGDCRLFNEFVKVAMRVKNIVIARDPGSVSNEIYLVDNNRSIPGGLEIISSPPKEENSGYARKEGKPNFFNDTVVNSDPSDTENDDDDDDDDEKECAAAAQRAKKRAEEARAQEARAREQAAALLREEEAARERSFNAKLSARKKRKLRKQKARENQIRARENQVRQRASKKIGVWYRGVAAKHALTMQIVVYDAEARRAEARLLKRVETALMVRRVATQVAKEVVTRTATDTANHVATSMVSRVENAVSSLFGVPHEISGILQDGLVKLNETGDNLTETVAAARDEAKESFKKADGAREEASQALEQARQALEEARQAREDTAKQLVMLERLRGETKRDLAVLAARAEEEAGLWRKSWNTYKNNVDAYTAKKTASFREGLRTAVRDEACRVTRKCMGESKAKEDKSQQQPAEEEEKEAACNDDGNNDDDDDDDATMETLSVQTAPVEFSLAQVATTLRQQEREETAPPITAVVAHHRPTMKPLMVGPVISTDCTTTKHAMDHTVDLFEARKFRLSMLCDKLEAALDPGNAVMDPCRVSGGGVPIGALICSPEFSPLVLAEYESILMRRNATKKPVFSATRPPPPPESESSSGSNPSGGNPRLRNVRHPMARDKTPHEPFDAFHMFKHACLLSSRLYVYEWIFQVPGNAQQHDSVPCVALKTGGPVFMTMHVPMPQFAYPPTEDLLAEKLGALRGPKK